MSFAENQAADEYDERIDDELLRRRRWFGSRRKSRLRLQRTPSMDSSDPSLLRFRVPYMPESLSQKRRALAAWPQLALFPLEDEAYARNFLVCGMNAIRAEALDMLAMVRTMEEHKRVLTHAAIERFFAWTPTFALFVERYLFVEEDVILEAVEARAGRVHGAMRTGSRMRSRGRLQKAIRDMCGTQRTFVRALPAGERLAPLAALARAVGDAAASYSQQFVDVLVPVVAEQFTRADVDRLRTRLIKYVMSHVGADDLLVLYTRWMTPKQVARWRARALMPAEFKFRSYHKWEHNVMLGHFIIPARFADVLVEETTEDGDQAAQWREQMRRAQSARARLEAGYGNDDDEYEDDGEYENDEGYEKPKDGVEKHDHLEYGAANTNTAVAGSD